MMFLRRKDSAPYNVIYRQLAVAASKSKAISSNKADQGKKKNIDSSNVMKAETTKLAKFVEFAEKASRLRLEFTEEEQIEHRRIGREYNRQYFMKHNRLEKDIATKAYLQSEALKALPSKLSELARIIDTTPSPDDRPFPVFDTPPIKGFNPRDYIDENKNESEIDDINLM